MTIKSVTKQPSPGGDDALANQLTRFKSLLAALRAKELPVNMIALINAHIDSINAFSGTDAALRKEVFTREQQVLRALEKNLQLVPKNHYRMAWLAPGILAFGLPLGIIAGAGLDNMALLAIGFPVGLCIGLMIGTARDKEAFAKGQQLNFR